MDFLGAALSSVASILFLCLVSVGVAKAFQVASTLSEIKGLLADIKRNTTSHVPTGPLSAAPMSLDSAEDVLRAVADLDHPVPPVTR